MGAAPRECTGATAGRHQAVPVPRSVPTHRRFDVVVGRSSVRWLGPAPERRIPLADRSLVLDDGTSGGARLDRSPTVGRSAVRRRGLGDAPAGSIARSGLGDRSRRRRRLSALAVRVALRVAHLGPALAVGAPADVVPHRHALRPIRSPARSGPARIAGRIDRRIERHRTRDGGTRSGHLVGPRGSGNRPSGAPSRGGRCGVGRGECVVARWSLDPG